MREQESKQPKPNVNEARRKLLKLGVYAAPTLLLLGKVTGAKASGQPIGPTSRNSSDGCGLFEKIVTFGLCK